jgi:hypothetical protein
VNVAGHRKGSTSNRLQTVFAKDRFQHPFDREARLIDGAEIDARPSREIFPPAARAERGGRACLKVKQFHDRRHARHKWLRKLHKSLFAKILT